MFQNTSGLRVKFQKKNPLIHLGLFGLDLLFFMLSKRNRFNMHRNVFRSCQNSALKVSKCHSTLTVLGIETSCDDTAVGVVNTHHRILAESKYNQWSVHKKLGAPSRKTCQLTAYNGGVIPNVAKNLHHANLVHAVSDCIEQVAHGWQSIDAIALTVKPGLEDFFFFFFRGIYYFVTLLNKEVS